MERKPFFISLILILFSFSWIYAQHETIKIENFSYKEGLTTFGVNSVYKDSRGFLWLCTNNGLFRYDGYSFRNINTLANGYLKYETNCITEDKYGNFWIGTAGKGMAYFNAHTGRLFSLNLSEGKNSKINSIFFSHNKIWLATNAGLLSLDEREKVDDQMIFDTKVYWPDALHKNLQMNVINFIYTQKGSKSLWVGTNSPLYEFDPDNQTFHLLNSRNQNSIRWLSEYYNGNILASSWDGGVFVVNPHKHQLENDDAIFEINRVIGDKRIKSAVVDKQNRYWIATFGDGLYIFYRDKNGKISYDNYRNDKTTTLKLKSDFVDQIFLDNDGTAWISMAEAGLSKIYFEKNNFQYFKFFDAGDKTKSKEIHAIEQSSDKNKFWISFNSNEIDLFNSQNYSYRQFTSSSQGMKLQKDKIKYTYQDKKGNLWICYSKTGIFVVPSKVAFMLVNGTYTGTFSPIDVNSLFSGDPRANSYVTSFYEDSKGRLWIGGWGTSFIVEYNDEFLNAKTTDQVIKNARTTQLYSEERKDQYKFTISPVSSILEVSADCYWLATRNGGIIELHEQGKNNFIGKDLDINDSLPSNYIKCLYYDSEKNLWIGTNSGLCYLKDNRLKTINLKDGLASECINNIAEDKKHNIWVSTSYGICRIDHFNFSVTNFYDPDNEKLNQFIDEAVAITPNGNIWFSTNESIVTFNADSMESLKINAPLYFTDIKINNHSINPQEKYRGVQIIENEINKSQVINIPYGSTLNIEFAALEFLNPGKILYKYNIGKNNEWVILSPGQRNLNLPNMNPGEYTLSVKIANSSGEGSSISIKINNLPPFWLSRIAYLLYFIIFLTILFIMRRLIIQKTLQKSLVEKERYEKKKIVELDKMKSEFFSNISHEFRTPLSLIINPLEKLVNEGNLSSKDKDRLKLVLKSSNRLLKLTNELMDFSKIEKELLKPHLQMCDIVSLTNETSHLFNNLADSMNIEFKVNYSFEKLEIPIDRGMIEKIVFNLLSNAFKYTSVNGVIMVFLSKVHENAGEYVKISVINTGEGISKENLNKVFDRYYQVNNVQNKDIAGTGIGLALVKGFAELHHGKVEVISEPNLETCFDIYLPVSQPDFTEYTGAIPSVTKKSSKTFKASQDGENSPTRQTYAYRILIVEDDEDIKNFISDELSSDYKVLLAKNGEEGLAIANEVIPDLIITDVMMPVLSGIELCKKIRNQVSTSHIPIIILSAKTNINEQITGIEMGADVYIIKPFSIDFLKAQVQRLISFKQAIYSKYLKETTLIPQDTVSNKLDDDFMKKVLSFIEDNLTNSDLNVDQLANCVSLSKVQTYRKVKAISGLSIVEFIRTVRLKKAAQLILEGRLNFSEIAFETGFSTPSYFSKCFHDHFGKTPSEFESEFGNKPSELR